METSEIVHVNVQQSGLLRPLVKPDELIQAQEELSQLIIKGLKDGTDYGLVPGTKGKKTLFKAGAERLQKAYGCHTEFQVVEKEVDHNKEVEWSKYSRSGKSVGLYRYVVRATVVAPNGNAVGSGLGSCSTLENKYVDRPRDLENTVLKMAQKRAKVAATLDAFALSDRFTQDMEDIQTEKEEPAREEWHSAKKQASIYTGTEQQQKIIEGILRKEKVPEEFWGEIDTQLRGKPSTELKTVIAAVRANGDNPAAGVFEK